MFTKKGNEVHDFGVGIVDVWFYNIKNFSVQVFVAQKKNAACNKNKYKERKREYHKHDRHFYRKQGQSGPEFFYPACESSYHDLSCCKWRARLIRVCAACGGNQVRFF